MLARDALGRPRKSALVRGVHGLPCDPERLKLIADEMIATHGARVLTGVTLSGVLREGAAISAVLVETVGGRHAIVPRMVVDASGDAEVVARADGAFGARARAGALGDDSHGAGGPRPRFRPTVIPGTSVNLIIKEIPSGRRSPPRRDPCSTMIHIARGVSAASISASEKARRERAKSGRHPGARAPSRRPTSPASRTAPARDGDPDPVSPSPRPHAKPSLQSRPSSRRPQASCTRAQAGWPVTLRMARPLARPHRSHRRRATRRAAKP